MKKWAIFILSAGLAVSGFAQTTRTWDAGGTNGTVLTTAANWSGDTLPASTSTAAAGRHDAVWNGSVAGTLNLTFGSAFGGSYGVGLVVTNTQTSALNIANSAATAQTLRLINGTSATVGGIQLASGAGAFTLGAAGTANAIGLTLGSGAAGVNYNYYFANNSANTATIEENVTITKGGSHNASLIFSAGNWNVKGVVGAMSGTAGSGSLNVNAGSVTLSANNTGDGAINVNGGTLSISAANNLGTGTGPVRLGQTSTSGILEFTGASAATISRQMRVGNGAGAGSTGSGTIANNGAGVMTFDNTTFNEAGTAVEARTLTLRGANTGSNLISGTIVNNTGVGATVRVVKEDAGKWVLSGDNTFTGGVDINGGTLAVGHNNALGTGTLKFNDAAARIQSSDATDRTIANAVNFAQNMKFGAAGTGNLLFTGAVNGGAAAKIFDVTGTTEFNNTISGAGDRSKNGTGTLVFSGDNSGQAFNLYVNEGALAFNSANALGSGTSAIRVGQTTANAVLKFTGASDATVGRQIRVGNGATAGHTGSSTIQNDSATGAITFDNATFNEASTSVEARSLTLRGSNTGNNLISGAIVDNTGAAVNVVKNDAGTWNLTGDNTFTGGLQIWNGVLEFDGNSSLGAQTIQTRIGRSTTSGTLRHTGASDTIVTGLMQVGFGNGGTGNGTIESSGVGTLSFNNATFNNAEGAAGAHRTLTLGGGNTGANTISGAIVNNNNTSAKIALTKTGAGTWVLDGANTYTGATTVEGGKLVVDGSTAAGSAVTVNAGAILGGSGTIGGATTVNGALNPGNSPGTLTFNAALTLGAASTSNFEIVSLASYDVLKNDGGDTITFADGATIVFNTAGYTANVGDSFQVLETWGGYSGTLASLTFVGTDLGGGMSLDTSKFLTDGTVSVIIPEPATIGMLGLGALITLLIRRQKQSIY